ncbi:hypothetical protein JOC34_003925 [Virgibacillus halotolerans]|nr:hypothetical protein [Virgibacillus halotolerans]
MIAKVSGVRPEQTGAIVGEEVLHKHTNSA